MKFYFYKLAKYTWQRWSLVLFGPRFSSEEYKEVHSIFAVDIDRLKCSLEHFRLRTDHRDEKK